MKTNATNILNYINKVFVRTEKGTYLAEPTKAHRVTKHEEKPNSKKPN